MIYLTKYLNRVFGSVLNNFSTGNVFPTLLLSTRFHQVRQAAFSFCEQRWDKTVLLRL